MYHQYKGQISIFIIISTIIVFVGIAFMVFSPSIKIFEDQTPSYQVQEFVEACMDQQLNKGLELMGRQGGWIYPPEEVIFAKRGDPQTIIELAKGVNELGVNKIPYWNYYDDTSQTYRTNYIPPYDTENENSLKMQLQRYLDETLESQCLNNFNVFEDAFDVFYDAQIEHEVIFREDTITANLELPLEIREISTNTTEYLEDYTTQMQNKIRVPYFLARDITNANNQNSFIELKIMQFLRAYMSKDTRELLPPTYDFSLNYDSKPWIVSDVEERIKQIISTHISSIQLIEAKEGVTDLPPQLRESELAQGITSSYVKNYLGNPQTGNDLSLIRKENPDLFEEYEYVEVEPNFEVFYPFSLSLGGSNVMGNSIVMPDANFFASFVPLGLTTYETSYEFHGPVIFSLKDSRQSLNDDFELRVAYEVNVQNNVPQKQSYPQPSEEITELQGGSSGVEQSLVCERSQFRSELVTLNLINPITNSGVGDVLVEFTCGNGIATCSLGQTTLDSDGKTDLSFRLPLNCDPGSLKLSKLDHKTVTIDNVNPSSSQKIELGRVEMPSTKELEIDLSTRLLENVGNSKITGGISPKDEGIIIFQHKTQDDFVRTKKFTSSNMDDITLDLLPGEYSIEIFVIREDPGHYIEEERKCFSSGPFSEKCVTIPRFDLETWVVGGYQFDSFVLSQEELIDSNSISIEILNIKMPNTYDELDKSAQELEKVKQISEENPPVLS